MTRPSDGVPGDGTDPHAAPPYDGPGDPAPGYAAPPSYAASGAGYGPPPYGPPPYAAHPYAPPPYGAPPYGAPPYGPPPYAMQYGPGYGYPPGMPYGAATYPPVGLGPERPGVAVAAAVMGFVLAPLCLLGSIITAVAVVTVRYYGSPEWGVPVGVLLAVASLAAGASLVVGGVNCLQGRPIMLRVASGVAAAVAVAWLVLTSGSFGHPWDPYWQVASGAYVWPALYLALGITTLALASSRQIGDWHEERSAARSW